MYFLVTRAGLTYFAASNTSSANMGNSGGYIKKLLLNSPLSKNSSDLWKPHIGQSIPKRVLYAQGNIWC